MLSAQQRPCPSWCKQVEPFRIACCQRDRECVAVKQLFHHAFCCCAVDLSLPQMSMAFLTSSLSAAGSLVLVVLSAPIILLACVPLFFAYRYLQVRMASCKAHHM